MHFLLLSIRERNQSLACLSLLPPPRPLPIPSAPKAAPASVLLCPCILITTLLIFIRLGTQGGLQSVILLARSAPSLPFFCLLSAESVFHCAPPPSALLSSIQTATAALLQSRRGLRRSSFLRLLHLHSGGSAGCYNMISWQNWRSLRSGREQQRGSAGAEGAGSRSSSLAHEYLAVGEASKQATSKLSPLRGFWLLFALFW